MTVGELINRLQALDHDLPVYFFDTHDASAGCGCRVTDVSVEEVWEDRVTVVDKAVMLREV